MRTGILVALGCTLAVTFFHDAAAEGFPSRPLYIVVPFAAGGGTDILARTLGENLAERLGEPVLIENKPGAGSILGANAVARAAPDGHTLLMATSTTMAINVSLHDSLSYDPAKDFEPLALICTLPLALVTNPSVPARSVPDLIALAGTNPGQLTFASAGPGSPHHLFAELFKAMTATDMLHVPYNGSAPALNDVVAGHVSLMFADLPAALPLIRSGKLRALGLSSAGRIRAAPDIPPIAEAGVADFDASAWQMVVAPAGTPVEIVQRLHAELKGIVASPAVQQRLVALGLSPIDSPPPDELKRFIEAEIVRWASVIERAGATAE